MLSKLLQDLFWQHQATLFLPFQRGFLMLQKLLYYSTHICYLMPFYTNLFWSPFGSNWQLPTFILLIGVQFLWNLFEYIHNTFFYNTIFYRYIFTSSKLLSWIWQFVESFKDNLENWAFVNSKTSHCSIALSWKLAPSKKFFCIHYQGFDWICRWNILLEIFWYFCSFSYAICTCIVYRHKCIFWKIAFYVHSVTTYLCNCWIRISMSQRGINFNWNDL